MKRLTITVIATIALMAGMTTSAEAFFKTPGGAVYCVAEGSMYCWTPNDGFTVQMGYGRATKYYVRRTRAVSAWLPTLRFGQSAPFTAASAAPHAMTA